MCRMSFSSRTQFFINLCRQSHALWSFSFPVLTQSPTLPGVPGGGSQPQTDRFFSPQAGSHIQTLMGSQSLQHRSREQQPYEGSVNKVTIQQFQSPLPIQIPSSQASRGPQPGRCLIQTKGQRSMDGYPEQVSNHYPNTSALSQAHGFLSPYCTVHFSSQTPSEKF